MWNKTRISTSIQHGPEEYEKKIFKEIKVISIINERT